MTALQAVIGWFAFGTVVGFLPRRFHPYGAYCLLLTFFPLMVITYKASGLLLTLVLILGGASILRYPFMYIGKRLMVRFGLRQADDA